MAPPTEKQRQLYANLMHEAKIRIQAIDVSCRGHLRLSDPFVREFCWLQLRMLCELIALSCLVAHGDVTFLQPHKVGHSYSADEILDRMSKLREHFYPIPIKVTRKPRDFGGFVHETSTVAPSPLPKEELLKLYGITHRHLHRGSLKGLLKMDAQAPWDIKINVPEIIKWAQKINDLLSHHMIALTAQTLIFCVLRNADDGGKVQVAVAEAGELLKPETA